MDNKIQGKTTIDFFYLQTYVVLVVNNSESNNIFYYNLKEGKFLVNIEIYTKSYFHPII